MQKREDEKRKNWMLIEMEIDKSGLFCIFEIFITDKYRTYCTHKSHCLIKWMKYNGAVKIARLCYLYSNSSFFRRRY